MPTTFPRNAEDIITQIGLESVLGTPVAPTKRLRSIMVMPNRELLTKQKMGKGFRQPTGGVVNRKRANAKFEGQPCYNELAVLLGVMYGHEAIVEVNDGPGQTLSILPNTTGKDSHKSLTIEHGDDTHAETYAYAVPSELELRFTREDSTLSGQMVCRHPTSSSGITTSGITYYEQQPISLDQISVYLSDTYGNIGNSGKILDNVFEVGVKVSEKYKPKEVLNRSYPSFMNIAQPKYDVEFNLKCENDAQVRAIRDAMRASNQPPFFIRVEGIGELIETGVYHRFRADAAVCLKQESNEDDLDAIFGLNLDLFAVFNSDMGRSHRYEFINTLEALA